jgi:multisubunit Na+/H+ antiporter MnhG subunit
VAVKTAEAVLVGLGVAGVLACCLGLVLKRNAFDRLHYVAAASALPPFLLAAAVLLEEGWTAAGIDALVVACLLLLLNAALLHVTARAGRLRRYGSLAPLKGELERGT